VPKTKVTRDWSRLPKEVLHDVYSLPHNLYVIKPGRMRNGGWGMWRVGERRDTYSGMVGKSEALRPIGKHRHRGG
jgi:hypothetical protein